MNIYHNVNRGKEGKEAKYKVGKEKNLLIATFIN